MRRFRKDDNASVMTILIVILIVAVIIVGGIVGYGYATRADDYANDPKDPPDEVPEDDPDPDWQGKFQMDIEIKLKMEYDLDWVVSTVSIKDTHMNLETYDGQPWGAASLWAAFMRPPSEKYEVKYVLSITKGSTTYEDKGSFWAYKDDSYKTTGKTKYFFFWEEQEGNWQYDLTVTCSGKIAHATGTLGLSGGKALVN